MTAKQVVLYARISVTTEESVSVARQLEAGRRVAEARGWEVVGEFVDDGVSATANRPEDRAGWQALLRTPAFDAVIIWKVDRLSRKVLDFLTVDQTLQARGAGLIAVEDPIDMTTPMGRAFATILAVFGEMEAAAISARVRAAREYIVRDGRWAGGGVPYGYMPIPNPDGAGHVLTHDPERADWLRKMFQRAIDGHSVNSIATWLTDQGAPLPLGAAERRKSGSVRWNRQAVDGIIRNPIAAGMMWRNPGRGKSTIARTRDVLRDDDGTPVAFEHLAIITIAEHEQVIATLDARTVPQSKPFRERRRTDPLMSKVALCDDCEMYLCRGTNQGKPVLYCPSCRQTISRGTLDPYIEERLLTRCGTQLYLDATVEQYWQLWGSHPEGRRDVLLSQLDSLRIRRGVAGRRFDPDRVLITWRIRDNTQEAA